MARVDRVRDDLESRTDEVGRTDGAGMAGIRLFKLLGFEVRLDWSWIFLALLVTWSLAQGYFPSSIRGLSPFTYWVMGVVGAIGLFGSIVFHELCHSLVGRRYGMPIKGIRLFIFGGIAEMRDEPPSAKSEFLMAGAGPLSSVVLGIAFLFVLNLGVRMGWPAPVRGVVSYLAFINVVLAVFNLLPGFPMDGGRMLRSALWGWKKDLRWATRVASGVGVAFGIALMFLGALSFLQGAVIGGIWYFLIGMFLQGISRGSYQQVLVREAFQGEPVTRFVNRDVVTVDQHLRLDMLVEDYFYRHHHSFYPVVEEGRLLGCVGTEQVRRVSRSKWNSTRVGDIMVDCGPANSIDAGEGVMEALHRMRVSGRERLMVTREGQLVGALSMRDLLELVSVQLSLRDRIESEHAREATRRRRPEERGADRGSEEDKAA